MVPINGSGLTRVALLNDFSCFGKCSLTVSIPIISSYGIETVPLPTAVLSTHTGGFDRFVMRDMTEDMRQIAAHWKEMDMQFDCIYTGFFCTKEQIAFAREFIRAFSGPQTIVLSDPVLGDNGRHVCCWEMHRMMRRSAMKSCWRGCTTKTSSSPACAAATRSAIWRASGLKSCGSKSRWCIGSCTEPETCSPRRFAARCSAAGISKTRCLPRQTSATAAFRILRNTSPHTGTGSALKRS